MSIEGQGHFFTIYFPDFVCFVLFLRDFVVSLFKSVRSDVTLLDNLKCIGVFCGVYDL